MPVAGWLVARFGSRRVVLGGVGLYVLALVGLGGAGTLYQLLPGLVLFGVGSNLVSLAVNTQALGVERLYGPRSIMASFHGLWSLAGFGGAAVGAFMLRHAVPTGLHFLFIAAFLLAGLAVSAGATLREDPGGGSRQPVFVRPDRELLGLGGWLSAPCYAKRRCSTGAGCIFGKWCRLTTPGWARATRRL